jgi:RsiW-degrading membrane proteinase PrsW (M82 family)
VGSTTLAMVVEYTLVLMAALAGGIIAVGNPEFRHILEQVKDQITNSGDVQSLLTSLAPYLTNPMVLVVALLFTAVIAPVFEEALKPVALWFLGKRMSSASEGFALGALCGAGFALLEGTLAAGGMAEMLGFGLAARMTSSLMHITASGIMGWGIASAILDKRYWRLAGAYLLSVSIHGLWNGSVILSVFGALRVTLQGISNPDIPGMVLVLAGILTLGASFLTIIILLPVFNRRLRPKRLSAGFAEQSVIIRPPENQS